jgi:hypothetical protein
VSNSRFSQVGFVSYGTGGAVDIELADPVLSTVSITNTLFTNITSLPYQSKYAYGNGGAVNIQARTSLVALSNVTINGASSGVGGGFSIIAGNATVSLTGVNVTGCTSYGVGGGGYVSLSGQYLSASLSVSDSTFVDNAATPKGDGGALFVTMSGLSTFASSIALTRVTVEGNVATGGCCTQRPMWCV